MWLIKIVLCWYCVFTGHFTSGSSLHSSEIKTQLINHTMELINKEFSNNLNTVIITYDLVGNQIVSENANNKNPIILVNSNLKRKQIYGYYPRHPTYVVAFESIQKLFLLILEFMNSPIWSIKSPIFILDTSERSQTDNASSVLGLLGSFDILVSYYLRYDSDKDSTMIYTLNPYMQRAPLPWNQVRFANSNNKTEQRLLSLHYPKDLKEQNVKIYFDKTQYLESHEVKILEFVSLPNLTQQHQRKIMNRRFKHIKEKKDFSLHSLSDYMNVTTTTYFFKNYFNIEMIKSGFDENLFSRRYDASNRMIQLADTNYKYTDFVKQYREIHFSILTKKIDYLTAIKEVNINLNFIFITMFMLLLILLMIIMNNKFHMSQGIMDIVSMSLSMGILSPIQRLSMKITYFFGFLFIFIVMPEFQGQISAILSQPARRNVETLKDLYDNKYYVFIDTLLSKDILNKKLWVSDEDTKYLYLSSNRNLNKCMIHAQQASTIACIGITEKLLKRALKLENLYVSKESVFKKYYVFWTKKNWALKDKIDKAYSIPVEIGLINHYDEEINLRKKIKKMEKIKEAENYERIDFENLLLYFITFAAIVMWSLIIFGIELIVYHNYTKYKRQEEERRQFIKTLRSQPRIIFFPGRMVLSNNRE